jgi:hypothetical protein
METLKGLLSKLYQQKTPIALNDDLVPRLVSKPNQRKMKNKMVPKPLPRYIPVEAFPQPELPDIVLRPPTPPKGVPKVEDLLFERSGSVFILRGSRVQSQPQCTLRPGVERLQVPAQSRIEKRYERNTEASEQNKDAVEPEHQDVDLRRASQLDYRIFMAGLET